MIDGKRKNTDEDTQAEQPAKRRRLEEPTDENTEPGVETQKSSASPVAACDVAEGTIEVADPEVQSKEKVSEEGPDKEDTIPTSQSCQNEEVSPMDTEQPEPQTVDVTTQLQNLAKALNNSDADSEMGGLVASLIGADMPADARKKMEEKLKGNMEETDEQSEASSSIEMSAEERRISQLRNMGIQHDAKPVARTFIWSPSGLDIVCNPFMVGNDMMEKTLDASLDFLEATSTYRLKKPTCHLDILRGGAIYQMKDAAEAVLTEEIHTAQIRCSRYQKDDGSWDCRIWFDNKCHGADPSLKDIEQVKRTIRRAGTILIGDTVATGTTLSHVLKWVCMAHDDPHSRRKPRPLDVIVYSVAGSDVSNLALREAADMLESFGGNLLLVYANAYFKLDLENGTDLGFKNAQLHPKAETELKKRFGDMDMGLMKCCIFDWGMRVYEKIKHLEEVIEYYEPFEDKLPQWFVENMNKGKRTLVQLKQEAALREEQKAAREEQTHQEASTGEQDAENTVDQSPIGEEGEIDDQESAAAEVNEDESNSAEQPATLATSEPEVQGTTQESTNDSKAQDVADTEMEEVQLPAAMKEDPVAEETTKSSEPTEGDHMEESTQPPCDPTPTN